MNGSMTGSLPRSVDTASTVQYNSGNASLNNSLQRATVTGKQQMLDDTTDAINSVGLPSIQNGRLLGGVNAMSPGEYCLL